MKHYNTKKRYCPHQIQTKTRAEELFRHTHYVDYVVCRYHISKASLYRWNKQYDGTRDSFENKFHKPKTLHPNAHTEQEIKWIKDYHRRNPNIFICELYNKLHEDKAHCNATNAFIRFRLAAQICDLCSGCVLTSAAQIRSSNFITVRIIFSKNLSHIIDKSTIFTLLMAEYIRVICGIFTFSPYLQVWVSVRHFYCSQKKFLKTP